MAGVDRDGILQGEKRRGNASFRSKISGGGVKSWSTYHDSVRICSVSYIAIQPNHNSTKADPTKTESA